MSKYNNIDAINDILQYTDKIYIDSNVLSEKGCSALVFSLENQTFKMVKMLINYRCNAHDMPIPAKSKHTYDTLRENSEESA